MTVAGFGPHGFSRSMRWPASCWQFCCEAAIGSRLCNPSLGTCDFLDPAFALDGNDATYFKSAAVPRNGDHFTVTFKEPRLVYALEVLTGINSRGLLNGGEVQVSIDGSHFATIGKLEQGTANVVLKDNRVRAIRLLANSSKVNRWSCAQSSCK